MAGHIVCDNMKLHTKYIPMHEDINTSACMSYAWVSYAHAWAIHATKTCTYISDSKYVNKHMHQ